MRTGIPRADGRHQRSAESRRRIVAAMLALVRAGNVSPSADAVAEKGGVGLRTVFRHFENMESLYREMNEAIAGEVLPIWQKPPTGADWRENFAEMLDRRTAIFEAILPLKVAADVHRHTSPFLEAETRRLVRMQREGLLRVLPAERREDKTLVEALDLTLSFDSWRRLRRDQKLSRDTARAVVARMADILLAS